MVRYFDTEVVLEASARVEQVLLHLRLLIYNIITGKASASNGVQLRSTSATEQNHRSYYPTTRKSKLNHHLSSDTTKMSTSQLPPYTATTST